MTGGASLNSFDTGQSFNFFYKLLLFTYSTADFARIGLGICYDVRFPELAMIAARQGSCPSEGEVVQACSCRVDRLPSFDLPRGIQFNDWALTLGTFATQPVREIARFKG